MLHRGLHVFSLKRYCVTVMDCWTPLRLFWTRDGALKWCASMNRYGTCAYAYRWHSNVKKWVEMSPSFIDSSTGEKK